MLAGRNAKGVVILDEKLYEKMTLTKPEYEAAEIKAPPLPFLLLLPSIVDLLSFLFYSFPL